LKEREKRERERKKEKKNLLDHSFTFNKDFFLFDDFIGGKEILIEKEENDEKLKDLHEYLSPS